MEYNFKTINIYIDEENNLIIIPTGKSAKMGAIMNIDIVFELLYPYTPDLLDTNIKLALDTCFSKIPDENAKIGALEKHLGMKNYSKAIQGRKLVLFNWDKGEGYSFLPMEKKRGYHALNNMMINLGDSYTKEELFNAFNTALKSCVI